MIEQTLMRIAKRGEGLIRASSSDSGVGSSFPFPASRPHSASGRQASRASSLAAWELAKAKHDRSSRLLLQTRDLPSAFASYAAVHAQIGALIWAERNILLHSSPNNLSYIVSAHGNVVAVIEPGKSKVAIRKNLSDIAQGALSLKELSSSVVAFAGDAADQFEHTTVPMLLWYFGQVMPEAIREIPDALLTAAMLLRKLPLVPPNALDVRHLQLIHLFSAGPIHLQTLFDHASREGKEAICGDLASLYFTGCLVSSHQAQGN